MSNSVYVDVTGAGRECADRLERLGFDVTRIHGEPVAVLSDPSCDFAVLTRDPEELKQRIEGRRVIVANRG